MDDTVPPRRTTLVQAWNVAWVPTASTATSTPPLSVRAMISATASFSVWLMTTLAPNFLDISRRSGTESRPMMRPPPRAAAPAPAGAHGVVPVQALAAAAAADEAGTDNSLAGLVAGHARAYGVDSAYALVALGQAFRPQVAGVYDFC